MIDAIAVFFITLGLCTVILSLMGMALSLAPCRSAKRRRDDCDWERARRASRLIDEAKKATREVTGISPAVAAWIEDQWTLVDELGRSPHVQSDAYCTDRLPHLPHTWSKSEFDIVDYWVDYRCPGWDLENWKPPRRALPSHHAVPMRRVRNAGGASEDVRTYSLPATGHILDGPSDVDSQLETMVDSRLEEILAKLELRARPLILPGQSLIIERKDDEQ